MKSEFQITTNIHAQRFVLTLQSWVQQNIFSDFKVTTKFDWNPSRRSSRGGIYKDGPGINMAMYWAMPNNHGYVYKFNEYPSFDKDKQIGGFYSTDPHHKLEAILAHEVAHAVQFLAYKKLNTKCKPHGPMFKNYYAMLREEFVNPKLPEQRVLAKEYQDYVAKVQATNINTLRGLFFGAA
jgi:hypothetical protein